MSDRFDHTLEHTPKSKPDEADDAFSGFRRIEPITGTGRRRRWPTDEKTRILVESLKPGANISEVGRLVRLRSVGLRTVPTQLTTGLRSTWIVHRNAARPRASVNNAAKMHSTDFHLQPNQMIEHCTDGHRT